MEIERRPVSEFLFFFSFHVTFIGNRLLRSAAHERIPAVASFDSCVCFLEMKKIRRATGNSFSIAVIIEYGRGKLDRDKTRAFRTGDETVSWL